MDQPIQPGNYLLLGENAPNAAQFRTADEHEPGIAERHNLGSRRSDQADTATNEREHAQAGSQTRPERRKARPEAP